MALSFDSRGSESRFVAYVEALTRALGHADRAAPFRAYCAGLVAWCCPAIATTALVELVREAKRRWRIERDYQDLKQELALGHYEGRGWRGFHHHATLCIAAYGFLLAERAAFPPSAAAQVAPVHAPPIPSGYRPRGSPRQT